MATILPMLFCHLALVWRFLIMGLSTVMPWLVPSMRFGATFCITVRSNIRASRGRRTWQPALATSFVLVRLVVPVPDLPRLQLQVSGYIVGTLPVSLGYTGDAQGPRNPKTSREETLLV
jgi:hypothetical protein